MIPAGDDIALVDAIRRIRTGAVDVAQYRHNARTFALQEFDRKAVYGRMVEGLLPVSRQ